MSKYKKNPRHHVVSIRVSDKEKAFLLEMTRRDQSSITDLMRKVITSYTAFSEINVNHG